MRAVPQDPSLPHQVILSAVGHTVYVTCNCRVTQIDHGQGLQHRDMNHIGPTSDRFTTQKMFNDPHNHRGSVPFTKDFEIHYKDVEGTYGDRSRTWRR